MYVQRSAASNISAGASAVGDATQHSANVVAAKAGDARDVVQDKLRSEEERQRLEEEKQPKKKFLGLF